jgi:hypothetical protein
VTEDGRSPSVVGHELEGLEPLSREQVQARREQSIGFALVSRSSERGAGGRRPRTSRVVRLLGERRWMRNKLRERPWRNDLQGGVEQEETLVEGEAKRLAGLVRRR